MKISNETKVGALTAIAITALILGYNYMKGETLFTTSQTFYALYDQVDGLATSNPVLVNGYQVGQVDDIKMLPEKDYKLLVTMSVKANVVLSQGAKAVISNPELLGPKAIVLELGQGTPLQTGDTLTSEVELNLTQSLNKVVNPIRQKTEKLLVSLDSVLINIDRLINDDTQRNLGRGFSNLASTLQTLDHTTKTLDTLINSEKAKISSIFSYAESIVKNLDDNNEVLNRAMANIEAITDTIASANLSATINSVSAAMTQLATTLDKMNNTGGSVNKLLEDPQLYTNLQKAAGSLDALLKDMEKYPGRYVHFSLFGGNKDDKRKRKNEKKNSP